jgi:RNA polymerase primary sigma factor
MLIARERGCRLGPSASPMTGLGFHFLYCIGGGAPAIRRIAGSRKQELVPGDIVNLGDDGPVLAVTGDVSLLGSVAESGNGGTDMLVIAAEDAVYGVADPHARAAGESLDLAGGSGAQTVAEAVNNDFEVVADSSADQQTLVRISVGRHHDFVARLAAGESAPPWAALSPARERQLVLASAAGDPGASEELIEAFLPAVAGIARMYRRAPAVDRNELIQEGVVGLLRATRRFDPSVGSSFWAYAAWWVRQAMQQLVSQVSRPTVLSDRAQRGLARVREARRDHFQAHGREPTPGELAVLVGLPREQVESLLAAERVSQPLHMPAEDNLGQAGVADVLADPGAEEEYERIISRLEIEQLRDLTKTLTRREREILYLHHGIDGPAMSLRAIGESLGISAERVRQIEAESFQKLRDAMLG